MIVMQHIWSRWTKRSRGANADLPRPKVAGAYPLPAIPSHIGFARHTILFDGFGDDFERRETLDLFDKIPPHSYDRDGPIHLKLHGDRLEVRLQRPATLQTRWPSHLPSPLFSIEAPRTANIRWSGRFGTSRRQTFFQDHSCWIAWGEAVAENAFLEAVPVKNIDYRVNLYGNS
jgi:hypothetical protein